MQLVVITCKLFLCDLRPVTQQRAPSTIPWCNDVVGEQAFMQSLSGPVAGAGKQNCLQVCQAIFAQAKHGENKSLPNSRSLYFSMSALPMLFHHVDGITLSSERGQVKLR